MTMRIHRAVRTLSLLLALSMLLSVSAISSAAARMLFIRPTHCIGSAAFSTHRFGFYARFG